jgi:phosphate transport system permease protein
MSVSLVASGRGRRRKLANRLAEAIGTISALLAISVLVLLIVSVFLNGYKALNWDFFTKGPALFGQTGGGIAPALVGTFELVALATLGALPVGVLIAIYVSEFAPASIGRPLRVLLDVLNGFPSIVIGVFAFTLLVIGHQQSGLAGSFALAVIMLPLVARATMEVLALVPSSLREASTALGAAKWKTTLSIVLPGAFGGILTGTTLAIARAAGETAPLLFTSAIASNLVNWDPRNALASIPVTIYTYSEQPDEHLHEQAWAAAFVLIVFVLVSSLAARWALDRYRRKLTG